MTDKYEDENTNDEPHIGELIKAMNHIRFATEQRIEYAGLQAKVYRAAFNAFVAEGFSKTEALEILKARGVDF